jgi:hypothetical protein
VSLRAKAGGVIAITDTTAAAIAAVARIARIPVARLSIGRSRAARRDGSGFLAPAFSNQHGATTAAAATAATANANAYAASTYNYYLSPYYRPYAY